MGSIKKIDKCPVCGTETLQVPCVATGCSVFYKSGRNLKVQNTGVSDITGQEGHVEEADIPDLAFFILKTFPQAMKWHPLDGLLASLFPQDKKSLCRDCKKNYHCPVVDSKMKCVISACVEYTPQGNATPD
jgi:hypothetical protein